MWSSIPGSRATSPARAPGRRARRTRAGSDQPQQLPLEFRQHGGRREGAGRKLAPGKRRSVSHKTCAPLHHTHPAPITLRIRDEIGNLRTKVRYRAIRAEREKGTGKLLDTDLGVRIDVLSTGRFPGDGKPKPATFPDPATTAIRGEKFALLPLPCFIELQLASGMTAARRLHDLADVLSLIVSAKLGIELANQLVPYVRDKYLELWRAAQEEDPYA